MDFGRRDVNIANEIYDYSKGAAMGRFKYPHRGLKMDRTTENIAVPVLPGIIKHYKDIHMDIDMIFVDKTALLLAISQDIKFIHCKPMTSSVSKQVQNALKQITLNYQARRFKVVSTFVDSAFEYLTKWARNELHIDLVTHTAGSHVPRAENKIKFVKEKLMSIQSDTPLPRLLLVLMF